MVTHELAGQPAPRAMLTNIPRLMSDYYLLHPDTDNAAQRVSFGTSGHRGTSFNRSFNEDHILAICQAICDYRRQKGYTGPLFLGMDTHALSEAAHNTAIEVFAANEVPVYFQRERAPTPTPVISHAILTHNKGRTSSLADGVVITPSHNPPQDGGFKYNPPEGGPADTAATRTIQSRANELLADDLKEVRRIAFNTALQAGAIQSYDFMTPYISDLASVIDMDAIRDANLSIGVDPMGGAAVDYWAPIADQYGLQIETVNQTIDPTFSFMPLDWDGQIRMDCSSAYAMADLIKLRDRFDISFGNDPDTDRHGIVTPAGGLMNPNHYLAVAVWYLFQNRAKWPADAQVGKTLVSSSMIDRVAASIGRTVCEVPVGFKWFVDGLLDGSFGFGGEESAGASFLRHNGEVWTTDKDGIILDLLAAEILAKTQRDPSRHYHLLEERFGAPVYERTDAPATSEQKTALAALSPDMITTDTMAGEKIQAKLTHAPGNNAPIGGLKVVTENGWFAARPSGTEDIYKIYAESFKGSDHLAQIQEEAQSIVQAAFA